MADWRDYQEQVAAHFRALGLTAETDVRLTGSRGSHDVDVLVEWSIAGVPVKWVVECKSWRRPIPKDRVLVLAGVVADVGADRGVLVAESGYQAGALRVATNANVTLTSLEDLHLAATEDIARTRAGRVMRRAGACARRVSRLWPWAPPQCRQAEIGFEEMLSAASAVLEINTIAVPQFVAGELPLSVGLGEQRAVGRTPEEAEKVMLEALAAAEAQLALLETQVLAAADTAEARCADLRAAVEGLVATGRALPPSESLTVEQGTGFVKQMRDIFEHGKDLRAQLPDRMAGPVKAVLKRVNDTTTLLVGAAPDVWDREMQHLDGLLRQLSDRIAVERAVVAQAQDDATRS